MLRMEIAVVIKSELETVLNQNQDMKRRIEELEDDNSTLSAALKETEEDLAATREAGKQVAHDLGTSLAQEKAEADLFHAAYVGMCTINGNLVPSPATH